MKKIFMYGQPQNDIKWEWMNKNCLRSSKIPHMLYTLPFYSISKHWFFVFIAKKYENEFAHSRVQFSILRRNVEDDLWSVRLFLKVIWLEFKMRSLQKLYEFTKFRFLRQNFSSLLQELRYQTSKSFGDFSIDSGKVWRKRCKWPVHSL